MKRDASSALDVPLRKVAVLVSSLDAASADALLDQIGLEEAAKIRRAVVELGDIDPAEQSEVMEQFIRGAAPAARLESSAIELDESLVRRFGEPEAIAPPPPPAGPDALPFQFLHEAAIDTLARFLQREQPQTIAVVVSHLSPDRAADVIARFNSGLQAEVLRRVVELDETDPHIIQDIEREMASLLSEHLRVAQRRSAGIAAAKAILSAADQGDRRDLMENLARTDKDLADQLGTPATAQPPAWANPQAGDSAAAPRMQPARKPAAANPPAITNGSASGTPPATTATNRRGGELPTSEPAAVPRASAATPQAPPRVEFDDLEQLDGRALALVLKQAGLEPSLIALTGASQQMIARIVRELPGRDARRLRARLRQIGPLRLADVEQAQKQLVQVAGKLAEAGLIQLRRRQPFSMVT